MLGDSESLSDWQRAKKWARTLLWKLFKQIREKGLYLYVAVLVASVFLGLYGFYQYDHLAGANVNWVDNLFCTLQLFTVNEGLFDWGPDGSHYVLALDIARFLAMIFTFSTVLMLLLGLFSERIQAMQVSFTRDHVIICGSGRIGSRLIREFDKQYPVVVVEQNRGNKVLERFVYEGVKVVYGDAKDPRVLKQAGVRRARYLIAVLGDDSANAEVAAQASKIISARPDRLEALSARVKKLFWPGDRAPLTCLVHILDPQLCDLIKVKEIESCGDGQIRLQFFNLYEKGARMILGENPAFDETGRCDPLTHILVIGLGNMGESLLALAGKRWWNHYVLHKSRLKVSVVDVQASTRIQALYPRYPSLKTICDIKVYDMDAGSEEFLEKTFPGLVSGQHPVTAVYVCLLEDSEGLSTALLLNGQLAARKIPITVRLNRDDGLGALMNEAEQRASEFQNLDAFGMWDRTCNADLTSGTREVLAQAIHEEYILGQKRLGRKKGDRPAIYPWVELRDDLKNSNRDSAGHISAKLQATLCGQTKLTDWHAPLFTFEPLEIVRLGILEHRRWCDEKIRTGWKWGEARDDENKIHPDLVPWSKLNRDSRKYDFEAIVTLPRVLSRVDTQIYRQDTIALVAEVLFNRDHQQEGQPRGGQARRTWAKLDRISKKQYLDMAGAIVATLDRRGWAITGQAADEVPLAVLKPGEIGDLPELYYHVEWEEKARAAPANTIVVPAWDTLSEADREAYAEKVRLWPELLSAGKMIIYHRDRQREIYKEELELVAEVQKAVAAIKQAPLN